MSVEIPKCAIAFGSVAPPQGDVIDLRVHLGCTKEVSSFEVLLQNWDKKYSPGGTSPINVGMDGSISIGRGANVPQIITCRVEKVQCLSPTSTEYYIRVSGRCWGEWLFRRVVTKTYDNKKGEEIVKDLLDYYVGLSHVRDSTELVENTDTTFTHLEYENSPVWDILKYIAESSDLAGVIGYDFRVAPDGKFEFFPKNSKTSSVSLSEKIEDSEYRKDILRIRNKIRVYGCQGKNFPANLDLWSESLDGWTTVSGSIELDTRSREGTYALRLNAPADVVGNIYRTFGAISKYQTFVMWAWMPGNLGGGYGYVRLFAPDSANYFQANISSLLESKCILQWGLISLGLGSSNMYNANNNPNGVWTIGAGNPQWSQISGLQLIISALDISTYILYDGDFGFLNGPFTGTAEDSASQNAYGLRELTETDEELTSDNECNLRAKALLAYFKDPAEYLTIRSTVIDYGNTPLFAGDKIHVTLPNENVDSDYRIESVEYHVDAKTQTLEITLELGKVPPMLADYLYGLRATTVTVEKLARTKLGRGAPSGGGIGGGGGLVNHHVSHETGNDNGVQWPSQEDGGWDKITGWVSPNYVGPFNDAVAIINFRTKNKAGTSIVDHHFDPSDNEHGLLGRDACRWLEIWTKYLNVGASAKVGQLNIGDIIVITPARVLQNVLADAAIITSGQFLLARMPRGDAGKYIRGYGTEFDPMYASIVAVDLPAHSHSGETISPSAINCNTMSIASSCNRQYFHPSTKQCSHAHSQHTGIGPDDHHARDHNHAGEALSPNSIAVNTLSVAVSVNCANWVHADILFNNEFRITEAENINMGKGLVFLNPKGKAIMLLSENGDLEIFGELKQRSCRLKRFWRKLRFKKVIKA